MRCLGADPTRETTGQCKLWLHIRRPRRGLQACVTLLVSSILFWWIVWGRFELHPPPCTPPLHPYCQGPSTLHLPLPWHQIRWKGIQKLQKTQKTALFADLACLQNPEMSICQKKKPLREASKHKGAFQKIPPQNKFIFLITWKSDFFQKMLWLMEIYRSKSIFYWKPKWSVWSIWTYSTG